MAVAPGSRLGPFEILSPLGAGGMGEVWRARDTRLQREVAIKVLPAALANDPERLARFEREARLLGSMNHPRIGGLLGLEDADGVPALVLELIEGLTLAQHLSKQGALPPADAIEVAQQIAEAMEYAHERGIIHRDLKPANIKFAGDGSVKVLDFGLAKALLGDDGSSSDPQVSQSPTLTLGTHAGVILGTAAYMAPEQARGKVVDRRADIWAFGVVLFEMLTGRPLFGGETVSDTIARILEREPDWTLLPAHTPERVRELLKRCLEKDARKRLRDIGDAKLDLEAARRDMASGIVPMAVAARGQVPPLLWVGIAVLVVVAFAGGMWLRSTQGAADQGVVRLSVVPPENLLMRNVWVSPDGLTMLARGVTRDHEPGQEPSRQLYRRRLDSFKWEPLPGTEGVGSYDVSDDFRWVYFVAPSAPGSSQEQMSRVAMDGSVPPTLVMPWLDNWSTWDALPQGGFAVSIGGDSIGVVEVSQVAPRQWHPLQWESKIQDVSIHETLPSGHACLGTIGYFGPAGWTNAAVAIDLESGKVHLLQSNAASPRLQSAGRLLLTRGSTVLAAPFDVKSMKLTGEPVAVFEGVSSNGQWDHGAINYSSGGTLSYAPGEREARKRWIAILRPGIEPEAWNSERGDFDIPPSISPNGKLAAITTVRPGTSSYELLLLTRAEPNVRKLAAYPGEDCSNPVFSPDGRSLAFLRQGVASTAGVYVVEVGDPTPPRLVLAAQNNTSAYDIPSSWTPEGSSIVVTTLEKNRARLRMITLGAGTPTVSEMLTSPEEAWGGVVSPDGRTIAFIERNGGGGQVSIAALGEDGRVGPSVQVTRGGAEAVRWAPGSRVLVFSTAEKVLMQCRVELDLSFSTPVVRARLAEYVRNARDFTIAPDGSVVVTHKTANEGDITHFNLVLGFNREVEKALARKPSR